MCEALEEGLSLATPRIVFIHIIESYYSLLKGEELRENVTLVLCVRLRLLETLSHGVTSSRGPI